MSIKRFHIDVDMEERWIPHFCSMLKKMEYNGNIGHSQIERFYSDGDGDFRPKFNFDVDFEQQKPKNKEIQTTRFTTINDLRQGKIIVFNEEVYDAG